MTRLPLALDHVRGLRCTACDKVHAPDASEYWCPACGPDGTLEILYDTDAIRRRTDPTRLSQSADTSIRRFEALLPVPADAPWPPLPVGPAPLIRPAPGAVAGLRNLVIFDDTRLPSGSLKDRATAVALTRARAAGMKRVLCASTGNAAASLATLAAACGMEASILVPAAAPRPKLAQLLLLGARVIRVNGTYDDAFDLSLEIARRRPDFYLRSTAVNPALSEGKKTVALEIATALDFAVPDAVAVAVGDGCIVGGIAKGFADLHALGWIERIPPIYGVQSEGSRAIADAFASHGPPPVREATTLADSISVSKPRDWRKAVAGVRQSGGDFVVVSDQAILAAMSTLARGCGVFAEPAGATPLAGVLALVAEGRLSPDAQIVVVVSGHGLKDTDSAFLAAGDVPDPMDPDPNAVAEALA